MEFYNVNQSIEFSQRNTAHMCEGGSPSLELCEDKQMLREVQKIKKNINLHEHKAKEKQHMKVFN